MRKAKHLEPKWKSTATPVQKVWPFMTSVRCNKRFPIVDFVAHMSEAGKFYRLQGFIKFLYFLIHLSV